MRHVIFWRTTEPVEPGPPLEGEVSCDVCIVGGGYTGLWTAYFLKKAAPGLDVRIVEADYAGAGASGHNDGFATPTIGHGLANVVRRFGVESSKGAYAAVGRSLLELGRFCRNEGIDAEIEPQPVHFVATRPEQMRTLAHNVELANRLGAQTQLLEGDQARAQIGSPAIRGALVQAGALINPHKLVRGLARVVKAAGVEIYERTPAISLERDGRRHVVRTPTGRVLADRLVLATNAYQHRFPHFRRHVKPVWSYAMVSDPVPQEWLDELPWPQRNGFVEVCNFIIFARLTAENRLLIGGGPAPYFYGRDMDESRMYEAHAWDALQATFTRYFPTWRGLRFTYAYGGCVAVTRNLVPRIGRMDDGTCYAYGYCGNGIVATHTAGKVLRDLVLDRDSDYTKLLFVNAEEPRFPVEPVAWVGAQFASRVLAWQDLHPDMLKHQFL